MVVQPLFLTKTRASFLTKSRIFAKNLRLSSIYVQKSSF
jgi:hypothetical protein